MEAKEALAELIDALVRRTDGLTGKQFDNMVSPRMADAFIKGWVAIGRDRDEAPGNWQDVAETYSDMG